MRWSDSITDSMDMDLNKLWETEKDRQACCASASVVTESQNGLPTEHQQDQSTSCGNR